METAQYRLRNNMFQKPEGESMKKKVALLLALVMVLSILPMNVFGRNDFTPLPGPTNQNPGPGQPANNFAFNFIDLELNVVSLPMAQEVSPGVFQSIIQLSLGGHDNDEYLRFSNRNVSVTDGGFDHTPGEAGLVLGVALTTGGAITVDPSLVTAVMMRGHDLQTATIVIESSERLPANGVVRLQNIPIRARHQAENPTLTVRTGTGVTIINERPLGVGFGNGVNITTDTRRNFQQAIIIPFVDIREQQVNALANMAGDLTRVVSFIAPRGYTWNTGLVGGLNQGHIVTQEQFRLVSRNNVINVPGTLNPISGQTRDGLHVLQFNLSGMTRNPLLQLQPDTLRFENLVLVAGPDAPRTGDVNIEVHVAERSIPATNLNQFANNHDQDSANLGWALSSGGAWRNRTLGVATRAADALELTVQGDVRELLSGRTLSPGAISGEGSHPEIRTGELRLTETALGALGTDWNNVVEFHFDQPGVQLLGAYWRVRHTTGSVHPANVGSWQRTTAPTNPFDPRPFPNLNAEFSAYIWRDALHIFMPRHLDRNLLRRIEVRFFVSVEAGFEWRYNENDIMVRVDGTASQNLAANNREIAVARVTDPIRMTLAGDPITVPVGQTFNMIQPTLIPDIVIEETEGGALRRGQRIQLAVDAFPTAVMGAQSLSQGTLVVDNQSGLQARLVHTTTGLMFEIERESNPNTPATITISGLHMMGTVFPGVQYVIGIYGGNSPVRNYLTENMAMSPHGATFTAGNVQGVGYNVTANTGFFQSAPAYRVDIISMEGWDADFVVGNPDDQAPPAGDNQGFVPGPAAGRAAFTLADWVRVPNVDQAPARTVDGVGLVAPRAFAYLAGEGFSIEWNEATPNVFTVVGIDTVSGENVSVAMTTGQPTAQVTRGGATQNLDISTNSAVTGRPAGAIQPLLIDGNNFLPARFLANMFGMDIEWQGFSQFTFSPLGNF